MNNGISLNRAAESSIAGRQPASLIVATLVAALGGFLFGYDNIVISGAIEFLRRAFDLDPSGKGWAAGCALIGCLAGSAGAGVLADRIGLKKSLTLCAACFAMSSVGVYFSNGLQQFVVWRMLGGVGIGAASILSPMYIAEIAPTRVRGRLVTLYQLGIVLGIFSAVFVNMFIQQAGDDAWNVTTGWKWMFLAGLAPAVLFAGVIVTALESPRWLMKMGRVVEARNVLCKISGSIAADVETEEIQASLRQEEGRFSELFTTGFMQAMILGILLAGFSQASGITPLFSYLPDIFSAAGTATTDAFRQTVLVSVINTIFTLAALWLVDKAGRRSLLILGTSTQFVAFAVVGALYFLHGSPLGVLAGVMAFVAGHAVGNGAVCWVVVSEIFPTKVRGRAMSVAITSLWVFAYLGNQLFPMMQAHFGNSGAFWCFSAAAFFNMLYIVFLVPETKGRSLEDIEKLWIK